MKSHQKRLFVAAISLAVLALPAGAQQANPADHAAHHPPQASEAQALQSEGEVRRVDLAQGKVTLRHGPLANLDMPAMTMVFTATDRALLEGLQVGDKVRFTAAKSNGTYLVTAIRRAD